GPLARDMQFQKELLEDPKRTAVSIVSLPEEMPANAAIELHKALIGHKLPLGPLFLNGVVARRFTPQERLSVARGGPPLPAGRPGPGRERQPMLTRRAPT